MEVVRSLMELPLNVLEEIVSKLPIKSIGVSRCVCKAILKLTSNFNPHFAALHSGNAKESHIIHFLSVPHSLHVHLFDAQIDTNPRWSSITKDEEENEELRLSPVYEIPDLPMELLFYYPSLVLLNACNGLIYCGTRGDYGGYSLVCNPITKECVKVPEVPDLKKTTSLWLGLGFSTISRVYKVLRMYGNNDGVIAAHIHDVGSSNSTAWKDVKSTPLDCICWGCSYAFMNGVGYWLCRHHSHDYRFKILPLLFMVSFDFESEMFQKIDPPPSFDKSSYNYMTIGIVRDLLHLIDNNNAASLDIWVMEKDGQWYKKYCNIDAPGNPEYCRGLRDLRPLQLLSNGEMLMVSSDPYLVCYDMKSGNFRLINLHLGSPSFTLVTFIPSFVSLKDALMGK